MLDQPVWGGVGGATLGFFSFFTILTNILAAAVMAAGLAGVRLAEAPALRAGVTVYIVMVGAVYHTVLAGLWAPQGPQWLADQLLHTVLPAMFVLDFVLFVPKARLTVRHAALWLCYPLAYCALTLPRGALTGWYPYPFLDPANGGWGRVAANVVLLILLFFGLGLGLVGLGRLRRGAGRTGESP